MMSRKLLKTKLFEKEQERKAAEAAREMAINKFTVTARRKMEGQRIDKVRYMTEQEASDMGWHRRSLVMVLSNGVLLLVSQDAEGNGAGALFGQHGGDDLTFPAL